MCMLCVIVAALHRPLTGGPFGQFYAKAAERRWWQEELACGHNVMLDMPNELTALLLQRS